MISATHNKSYQSYIDDVIQGRVIVGDLTRLAVQRHIDDLKKSSRDDCPYYFSTAKANAAINLFKLFRLTKGEVAGQEFVLNPWQQFIIASIFGWLRKDNHTRRYRRAYIEVARKNGKSTLMAAIGLIMLLFDGEEAAEVYSAATKRDQAKIVWDEACRMIRKSTLLYKMCRIYRDQITCPSTNSKFVPLASDSKSLDGLSTSCGLVDELHAHPTADVWELLDSSTGARKQPLILTITTAGTNLSGIGYQKHQMAEKILNGQLDNDGWFCFIAALDKNDDYLDSKNWIKANPNLPYMPSIMADLEAASITAKASTSDLTNFLIKRCCLWQQNNSSWLDLVKWDACKKADMQLSDFYGRDIFLGIDYAQKADLTSICILIPPKDEGEPYRYFWKHYLPKNKVDQLTQLGDNRWKQWQKSGELIVTDGVVTDQQRLLDDIRALSEQYNIVAIGQDPWGLSDFANDLQDFVVIDVSQKMQNISNPSKEFDAQILAKTMAHNSGSLTRWMAENVVIYSDNNGNIKPQTDKGHRKKIDGIIAAIMALTVQMRYIPPEEEQEFFCFAI
jgi:phage terminase large subunit-like protein